MFGRQIFRNTALESLATPEDLDELLHVNSSRSWLLLAAVVVVMAGILAWSVLGSIEQVVTGTGICITHELPRDVVSDVRGQIDAIHCAIGDTVEPGQELMLLRRVPEGSTERITARHAGIITDLRVRVGDVVEMGAPVLAVQRPPDSAMMHPSVVLFVAADDVARLQEGMPVTLGFSRGDVPEHLRRAHISVIATSAASPQTLHRWLRNGSVDDAAATGAWHEVHAVIDPGNTPPTDADRTLLTSMNGMECSARIVTARRTPISHLF